MATKQHSLAEIQAKVLVDERARVGAILESAEGQRNPTIARQLVNRGMDATSAIELLSAVPAPVSPYLTAMDRHGVVGLTGAASGAAEAPFAPVDTKAARLAEIKTNLKNFKRPA